MAIIQFGGADNVDRPYENINYVEFHAEARIGRNDTFEVDDSTGKYIPVDQRSKLSTAGLLSSFESPLRGLYRMNITSFDFDEGRSVLSGLMLTTEYLFSKEYKDYIETDIEIPLALESAFARSVFIDRLTDYRKFISREKASTVDVFLPMERSGVCYDEGRIFLMTDFSYNKKCKEENLGNHIAGALIALQQRYNVSGLFFSFRKELEKAFYEAVPFLPEQVSVIVGEQNLYEVENAGMKYLCFANPQKQ